MKQEIVQDAVPVLGSAFTVFVSGVLGSTMFAAIGGGVVAAYMRWDRSEPGDRFDWRDIVSILVVSSLIGYFTGPLVPQFIEVDSLGVHVSIFLAGAFGLQLFRKMYTINIFDLIVKKKG